MLGCQLSGAHCFVHMRSMFSLSPCPAHNPATCFAQLLPGHRLGGARLLLLDLVPRSAQAVPEAGARRAVF